MAELSDIIKRLKENDKSQDQTTEAIDELTQVFRKKFLAEERGGLDRLERRRERRPGAAMPTLSGALAAPMSIFDELLGMLNRLAIPGAIGALASIGEFDDFVRAIGVPSMVLKANNALTRAAAVVTSLNDFFKNITDKIKVGTVKTAKFADVAFIKPIVRFGQFVGDVFKPIGAFIDLAFIKPIVRIGQLVGDVFKAAGNFIDLTFIKPIVRFGQGVGNFVDLTFIKPVVRFGTAAGRAGFQAIGKFLDLPLIKPIVQFIDGTGKAIANVTEYLKVKLPDFSKISIADVPKFPVFEGFEKVRTFLFGAADATGARVGGVFGFFQKIGNFKAIRIVGGPVVQGVLTLIDGIMGFFRGFGQTMTAVYDPKTKRIVERALTMEERLLNGVEGAADGIVKGITDAFQAFFITIPIWLSDKILGTDLANTSLANVDLWNDLVKPIWEGIKAVFKFIFSAEYRKDAMDNLKEVITGPDGLISDLKEWFTNLFDFLPSWQEVKETLRNLLPDWMKPDDPKIIQAQIDMMKQTRAAGIKALTDFANDIGVESDTINASNLPRLLREGDRANMGAILAAIMNRDDTTVFDAQMAAKLEQLAKAKGNALGGKTVSQISESLGHLVKLHPNEVVIPLDKTSEGAALKKLDKILSPSNMQLAMVQAQNSRMSGANTAPIIINNVDNSNVNNSQSDRRTYVATGGVTDGFNLNQAVQ